MSEQINMKRVRTVEEVVTAGVKVARKGFYKGIWNQSTVIRAVVDVAAQEDLMTKDVTDAIVKYASPKSSDLLELGWGIYESAEESPLWKATKFTIKAGIHQFFYKLEKAFWDKQHHIPHMLKKFLFRNPGDMPFKMKEEYKTFQNVQETLKIVNANAMEMDLQRPFLWNLPEERDVSDCGIIQVLETDFDDDDDDDDDDVMESDYELEYIC